MCKLRIFLIFIRINIPLRSNQVCCFKSVCDTRYDNPKKHELDFIKIHSPNRQIKRSIMSAVSKQRRGGMLFGCNRLLF